MKPHAAGPGHRLVYLYPGELVASAGPCAVTTVVGSCIAVFLWDGLRRQGGMNHFLLPHPVAQQTASPRFGTVAIRDLLARLAAIGSRPCDLTGRLFGGAHLAIAPGPCGPTLGEQNAALAKELLGAAGVIVISAEVGGTRGRRVACDTDDGSFSVREL